MDEAYREWDQIERLHGSTLMRYVTSEHRILCISSVFRETGLLCFADEEENDFLNGVVTSFKMTSGSRHTIYEDDQLRKEFPQLKFRKPMKGCLDHSAGVLLADKALRAVQELAVSYGAHILDGHTVDKVEDLSTFVEVTTGERKLTCRSVCLCPGPWAGPLLSAAGLSLPLTPVKIPVYYWR